MPRRLRLPPRAAHALLVLAGLGAALILTLPVGDVAARCPARGEGYDLCWVQKALAPTVLTVLAGGLLGHLLARLLLVRLPAHRARLRSVGERRMGEPETREEPPYARDPFLLASTWGAKQGRSERRRPRVGERLARAWRRRLRD